MKVFVSYKYGDEQVADLNIYESNPTPWGTIPTKRNTRVRDYVDKIQAKVGVDHMNLGEKDGESLAQFQDRTIETSLKKKIFQSSVTIVLISQGMKDMFLTQSNQWIPWEISYSLRTIVRENQTSRMNGVLGIVLPDRWGSYDWYYTENPQCNCTSHNTNQLFEILRRNMFNLKYPELTLCNGTTIHHGEFSYIKTVRWDIFMQGNNYNTYLDSAKAIRDKKEDYNISINITT